MKGHQDQSPRVLMLGTDLTSRGGIASVVKSLFAANLDSPEPISLKLIKTSHYQDKGLMAEILQLLTAISRFCLLLVTFKPNIVHIHSSAYISFFRKSIFVVLARLFGRTTVFHIHSSAFDDFFLTNNRILRGYIGFVLKRVDVPIVLCREWRDKLEAQYSLKETIVLPNPVATSDPPDQRECVLGDYLTVLFLGFLIESKGVLDLLRVATEIRDRSAAVKFVVCGKGPLETEIRDQIALRKLDNVVEFRGWVEGAEKKKALLEADVFILPSYKEGMPISILEAMSYGLPIVSTNIAGIPDQVTQDKNGYLLEPGDVEGFYRILVNLARDRAKVAELGKASRDFVHQFDRSVIWGRLLDIYRNT